MSATLEMPVKSAPKLPTTLNSGDCLTQKEFHAIYSKMPKHVRAELIGGIVYVASPMKRRHGMNQTALGGVILAYEAATPGTESGTSVTVILDQENEQQPDICLRILPEFGGRTQTTDDDYIAGAPEFVCEISDSTRSLDLNAKKREYAEKGVLEYLVFNLRDSRFHWFDFATSREHTIDADGIIRIKAFPGLWIDTAGVLDRDLRQLLKVLDIGLASPEHTAFLKKLAAAKKS